MMEGHQQKSGLNPDYLQGPSCNVLAEHLMVLMASSPAFRCHYPCSRDVGVDFLVLPGDAWPPNDVGDILIREGMERWDCPGAGAGSSVGVSCIHSPSPSSDQ